MARPTKKEEVESKKKTVVVEVKALEKPSPKPSPATKNPISSAPLANPFDLLDEDSSDLISIVDAKEDDAFVAAERKRIEEEKKAEREAKIKAREEEKKVSREAKKKAIQEKKARDASILKFHSARPNPSDSRGPKSASATDDVQSQLAQNPSEVDLQVKVIQGGVVEDQAASVDGSSSISSDGRGRANVNGSLRRKQKKKKAEGEGDNQPEKQSGDNAVTAHVVNNNYPRSYTLKEYEERKKREEVEKNKKADGMDHKQEIYDNGGYRRFANGGPRRVVNDKQQVPIEKTVEKRADVKAEASFRLEDSDFPVLGVGKAAVKKAPGKMVAGKVVAKKFGAKKP